MSIDPSEIRLTPEQQAYIAHQADRQGVGWPEVLGGMFPVSPRPRRNESALDVAKRLGLVGCSQNDPSDLATNPDHLEGFGQNANGSSTH